MNRLSSPFLGLAAAAALGAGCSLILDAEGTQCSSDSDCASIGATYRCDQGICVEDEPDPSTTSGSSTGLPGSTGQGSTSSDPVTTTSASSSSTSSGEEEGSTTTGGPLACPQVDAYTWSESIAVVRNACELPSLVGSVLTRGENEAEVSAPFEELPFDICLYGVLAEQLWIGDNGYVTIGGPAPEALQSDVGVPHSLGEPGVPAPGVVPFWDSLQPSASGVCVAVEGDMPNRTLWVTWSGSCFEDGTNMCDGSSGSSLTFSVGFEESTGAVIVGYVSMTGEGGLSERASGQTATTGVTNTGPRGCAASDCDDAGSCGDGSPCNYTEVASSEIRTLDTVVFEPVR